MHQTLIHADGAALAYRKYEAQASGVVFLGGFMSDMTGAKATYLEGCCERWGRSYVRFDYFGHGRSSGNFEDGTIGRWLEDTLLILDTLTEGPQVLVGSSMGGWLMALVALHRPDKVRGLVGIGAAPDFLEHFDQLTLEQQAAIRDQGVFYIPSDYGRPYAISKNLLEEGRRHRILKLNIPLNCPVRLLHGLSDTVVPWRRSVLLARCFTSEDVMVTLLKGGDHSLSSGSHLECLGQMVYTIF